MIQSGVACKEKLDAGHSKGQRTFYRVDTERTKLHSHWFIHERSVRLWPDTISKKGLVNMKATFAVMNTI